MAENVNVYEAVKKNSEFGLDFRLVKLHSLKTGWCKNDCAFCGQSSRTDRDYMVVKPFSSYHEIESAIEDAVLNRADEILFSLSNAESVSESKLDIIKYAIAASKERGLNVSLDFGVMEGGYIRSFYECGADIYISSIQTAKSYFPKICTTQTFEQKVRMLELAKQIGYEARSGGILGIGESDEHRYEFSTNLQDLPCDNVLLSFFQPIKGTPMGNYPKMTSDEALHCLALMRLNIDKPIYLLGGREKILSVADQRTAMQIVNGTTVGNYLFTEGERIEKLRNILPPNWRYKT